MSLPQKKSIATLHATVSGVTGDKCESTGGRMNKISNLRMKVFNTLGDVVIFKGHVSELIEAENRVIVKLASETEKGVTVTAEATVTLPRQ